MPLLEDRSPGERTEVLNRVGWIDVLLAVASGALTAFAFPRLGLSFLGWVSLIPLLLSISRLRPRPSFFISLLAGLVFYGILLYWIPAVPAHYGNLSLEFSLLIYLALILLLALFWGLFGYVFSAVRLSIPWLAYVIAPFAWISLEYALTYVLTGFPWGLLGYTQYLNLPLVQTAALTGVYGVSFILVLLQSGFVFSWRTRSRTPFFAVLAFALVIHIAGFASLRKVKPGSDSFEAAVIQGNVSSNITWNRISTDDTLDLFNQHLDLTRQAFDRGARLIVWPEFSVPMCFSCSEPLYEQFERRLLNYVKSSRATLLIGTNETLGEPENPKYYNSALCLSPDQPITQYAKMHLVPFGEYTPYKSVFSFVRRLTRSVGEVTPGSEHVLHTYKTSAFASPICYEIIFPDLVRKFTKRGARFLVTITNDGWYGSSWAPYQHFAIAVFRSVENRRFLLRAATTGISGIIDPYGRVLAKSALLTQTHLTGTVTPFASLTPYSRHGDVFALAGLTLSLAMYILALFMRASHEHKRKRAKSII